MSYEIIAGNCLDVLYSESIQPNSVQCCVTSPPYFGLRDYGVKATIWGGDRTCKHSWVERTYILADRGSVGDKSTIQGQSSQQAFSPGRKVSHFCKKCDAWKGCLGGEPTPDLFVKNLGLVLAGIHRVLRPDGTAWVNLGDSYWGSGPAYRSPKGKTLKNKDLIGVPWRFAFAAQGFCVIPAADLAHSADLLDEALAKGDWEAVQTVSTLLRQWSLLAPFIGNGMWLRSDIIWAKPNPQPESTRDRCTKCHEYFFLLAKSERYFFDPDAIAEEIAQYSRERYERAVRNGEVYDPEKHKGRVNDTRRAPMELLTRAAEKVAEKGTRNKRTVWSVNPVELTYPDPEEWDRDVPDDVWEVPTAAFKGPHYAVFPPELIVPCIRAGTSEHGACPGCGAPWQRMTRSLHPKASSLRDEEWKEEAGEKGITGIEGRGGRRRVGLDHKTADEKRPVIDTIGWRPTCACYDKKYLALYPFEPGDLPESEQRAAKKEWLAAVKKKHPAPKAWKVVPCVVLDPFGGMQTTAMTADRLGRHGIGIELNPRDVLLGDARLRDDAPLFHCDNDEPALEELPDPTQLQIAF